MAEPATCRRRGFVFHHDTFRKPGKCPQCKGAWISEPLSSIGEGLSMTEEDKKQEALDLLMATVEDLCEDRGGEEVD